MADAIKGQVSIEEQADSPQWHFAGGRAEAVRTYKGRYLDMLGRRPKEGDTMPETGELKVVDVRITPGPGEGAQRVATMTVTLNDDHDTEGDDPKKPIYEIDWVEQVVDLKRHPRYHPKPAGASRGGESELTDKDCAEVLLWESEPDVTLKANAKFRNPVTNQVVTLSDHAKHLCKRLLRGFDTYTVHYPIARKVSFALAIPETNPCDLIQSAKPFAACPAGLQWLSSADRSTRTGRSGKWQRQEEYIGAHDIDPDIYEAEPA